MVTRIHKHVRGRLFLAEHMKAKGIDDKRLADRMGVARETVTRYRKYPARINTPKLAEIAHHLDMDVRDLWQPPDRPSVDAILRDAPDELVKHAADYARMITKTGT